MGVEVEAFQPPSNITEMKAKSFYMILAIMACQVPILAQQENKMIRQGNKHYNEGQYKDAEIDYIKSMQSRKPSYKGVYNLGDALYMQKNYPQATAAFDSLRALGLDKRTESKAYYNLGNSLLKLAQDSANLASKALPASVSAYKNSLKINPGDSDAKYNLAYAQKLIKKMEQQQQQQQQGQDKNDQQDKDQQQQKDQSKDQQTKQDQKQQQQPQEISKEDAERILDALKNDEMKTLDKLREQQVKMAKPVKSEKDW
jgi:Ca-activated chloride channel family protein